MRSFFISLFCLLALVIASLLYNNYSNETINSFIDTIEYGVLVDVEAENWEQAQNQFDVFEENWHDYKKYAYFFFSTDKLNEADFSIARIKYYIKSNDVSNSSGELSCLKEQLKSINANEFLTLSNLF